MQTLCRVVEASFRLAILTNVATGVRAYIYGNVKHAMLLELVFDLPKTICTLGNVLQTELPVHSLCIPAGSIYVIRFLAGLREQFVFAEWTRAWRPAVRLFKRPLVFATIPRLAPLCTLFWLQSPIFVV